MSRKKMFIIIGAFFVLALSICAFLVFDSKKAQRQGYSNSAKLECEKTGGLYTYNGLGAPYVCFQRATDAGKDCSDNGADAYRGGCQGYCQVNKGHNGKCSAWKDYIPVW